MTVLSGQEAESDGPAAGLTEGLAPGQARFSGKRLLLGCAEGAYEVRDLKPDGKQAMDARAFAAGAAALRREKGGLPGSCFCRRERAAPPSLALTSAPFAGILITIKQ